MWVAVGAAQAADPQAGALKADAERCIECHGVEGQGDGHGAASRVRFAKLAGQQPDYLVQQLMAFRNGTRRSDVMQLNVRHLNDADLRDLAAYYATRSPMRADTTAVANSAPELVVHGDATRRIAACVSCHNPQAASGVPRLAGQDERYLAQQLEDYRSGWRKAPVASGMNEVARRLSDAEIRALAAYLASQVVP
jgi:cytochrome c553